MKPIHLIVVAAAILSLSGKALAYTHNYVNDTRSSIINHVFVSSSVETEFGPAKVLYEQEENAPSNQERKPQNELWRGTGFNTNLGVEVLKFIQFHAGHTFVNMRQSKTSLVRLSGSRANAGARLVFMAPLANLELGGGVLGSRYDYAYELQSSDVYGSGYYYSIGSNYFIQQQISFFLQVKMINEHLVKSGGNAKLESMDLNTTNVGAGFSIWL